MIYHIFFLFEFFKKLLYLFKIYLFSKNIILYPFFNLFWYPIYSFWIFLLICFFVFFYMLRKLKDRYSFDMWIFMNNVLWYFLSMFFFSRLFYVISKWSDLKYIENASEFFVTTDYNFSLFGALFGFFLVLFINLKLRREKLVKYIDSIVLAFLLTLSIWYIWALLWWQVYWKATNLWIEIVYNSPFAPVSSNPIFPLPIIYFILFFIEFAVLYILSMYIKVKWFIGHIWLIIFALIILIFENFSGKHDIFNNLVFLNMNQILSIFLMWYSFYRLYVLSHISTQDTTVIIDHK